MTGAIKELTGSFKFNIINYDFPRWNAYEWDNWRALDGILGGLTGGVIYRGEWALSTAYLVGDRVFDPVSGYVYYCQVAHTSPASGTFAAYRTANPTHWRNNVEVPIYKGAWAAATAYYRNDIVFVAPTKYYFCIAAHTSSGAFATDIANWTLLFDIVAAATLADYNSQCRLDYVSATQIKLSPYKGNKIIIDNTTQLIPTGGVTLSNSGMSSSTLYYIYAYMNSGTMTLEYSTTAYTIDTTTGIPYKTGDTTRALVGGVYTNGSSQFQDTTAWRGVSSWFNRLSKFTRVALTSDFTSSTASTTITALTTIFVAWTDDTVMAVFNGNVKVSAGTASVYLSSNPGNEVSTRTVSANTTYRTEALNLSFVPTSVATAVIVNVTNSSSTITVEGLAAPTVGYGCNVTVYYNG
jgi:hypothetical protein